MPTPTVTILSHARIASPEHPEFDGYGVEGAPLKHALEHVFGTDAHCTAYAPHVVTLRDGTSTPVRLTYDALEHGITAHMQALIGDVDPPGHIASQAWRAEVEPRLAATGYHWYATKNGYRVIAPLDTPQPIKSRAESEQWKELYRGWLEHCEHTHKLTLDPACEDWTRLYRLPNVTRDGEPQRAPVCGAGKVWTPDDWREPTRKTKPTVSDRDKSAPSHKLDTARALAERLPPSVEGHGGDESLFKAASELATILGPDARAIEQVLAEVFNPRCTPLWDARKLEREALRAAARQSDRATERVPDPRVPDPRVVPAGYAMDEYSALGPALSLLTEEPPLDYYCEGLRLAPSEGKVSIIAGNPGGGKGPTLNHLAICFALGLPAFGDERFACKRKRVLLVDCEGARLTKIRLQRLCRGIGRELKDLEGWLELRNAMSADFSEALVLETLDRLIKHGEFDVLLLDSYTSAMLLSGLDSNKPEYAVLAKQLGTLGKLVICVAHANKAAALKGSPALHDISGAGGFGAMAQTAIVLSHPDREANENHIRISFARVPEDKAAPFDVEWSGAKGEPLRVRVLEQDEISTGAEDVLLVRCKKCLASIIEGGRTTAEMAGATGLKEHAAHALEQLRLAGLVMLQGRSWYATDWVIGTPPEIDWDQGQIVRRTGPRRVRVGGRF